MYKIKVLSRGKVILGDLGLSLKQGDTLDLDERFPRALTEGSYNLNSALNKEQIAVLHKDVEKPVDMTLMYALEQRLRQSILEEMRAIKPAEVAPQPDLHNKLDALITAISQQKTVAPVEQTGSTVNPIGDDKAIDIHTRAVNRLTKDAQGHIEAKQNVKDSDAAARAKELEDLL